MEVSNPWGYPRIIHFNRLSIINHPFWGMPIYGNPHINSPIKSSTDWSFEFSEDFTNWDATCVERSVFSAAAPYAAQKIHAARFAGRPTFAGGAWRRLLERCFVTWRALRCRKSSEIT